MSEARLARLPHAGAARWVRRIVAIEDDTITCEGEIPDAYPLAAGGSVASLVALELAAQAAALLDPPGDEPAPRAAAGFLVRLRDVRCHRPCVETGLSLTVVATRTGAAPPLAIFDVRVEARGERVVEGTLATWSFSEDASG